MENLNLTDEAKRKFIDLYESMLPDFQDEYSQQEEGGLEVNELGQEDDNTPKLTLEVLNNHYLSVNGNVVIPVREIEKSINTNTVMDVDIQNENDELIATLCLMNLDHQENVYSLSKK